MQTALQLYTVRDALQADVHGTLEAIGQLGLDGVELAGSFGGLTPEAFKAKLEGLNLRVCGMHVGLDTLETELEAQLELARFFSAPYLVCPWLPETLYASGWDAPIAKLTAIRQRLEGSGVGLAYHNHRFEFETRHGDGYALDAIAGAEINLELDIAWAHAAGVDPAAYLRAHAGHVPLVHVKDVADVADQDWQTVELGRGSVDLNAAITAARDAGAEWLILEQDHCAGNALDSVRENVRWMQTRWA
jgi:sugar phosphate isomerase/epimerase